MEILLQGHPILLFCQSVSFANCTLSQHYCTSTQSIVEGSFVRQETCLELWALNFALLDLLICFSFHFYMQIRLMH